MDIDSEQPSTKSGQHVKTTGWVLVDGHEKWAEYQAFLPNYLPPAHLEYSHRVVSMLSEAVLEIGKLRTMAGQLSPFLISGIARASIKKEAQLSSKIEGTIVPTLDLIAYEPAISTTDPGDVKEVQNFDNAQRFAISEIKDGKPISQHLLRTTHEIILTGVRGEQWHPGEYRKLQNMVGSKRDVYSARYVPPPVEQMQPLMENLFQFMGQVDEIDSLIKIGLAHYQFEAIHPFEDGNGRLGRLLIILMMIRMKLLDDALIYPSAFFEINQEEYRDRLLRVSTHGDWSGWLAFFLAGVREACRDAIERCERFVQVISEAEEKVKRPQAPQTLFELIRLFADEFVLKVKYASERLGVSNQVARNYFRRLEDEGIIAKLGDRKRDVYYYMRGVYQIYGD